MEKISINLLPSEYSLKQKQKDKWSIVQTFSLGFLLLLIFLASAVVALRILQSQNINQTRRQTQENETRITNLKGREAALIVLKSRVEAINKILKEPSKQAKNYQLLNDIVPPQIIIDSISVDSTGNILASATLPNVDILEDLLSSMADELNSDTFTKVEIESLARSRDGSFRTVLKIHVRG